MRVELEALKRRLYTDASVKNVKFFPGRDNDSSPEDYAREINKFFADEENGNSSENSDLDINRDLDN